MSCAVCCREAPAPASMLKSLGPRAQNPTADSELRDALVSASCGSVRDLREMSRHMTSHVHVRVPLSAPMTRRLRPWTAHGSLGPLGSGSRCHLPWRASTRTAAAPAARSRPADPVGSGGRRCVAEQPVMRSRRWPSGSVGPPGPARRCPDPVKPILLMDIGVCMSHPYAARKR